MTHIASVCVCARTCTHSRTFVVCVFRVGLVQVSLDTYSMPEAVLVPLMYIFYLVLPAVLFEVDIRALLKKLSCRKVDSLSQGHKADKGKNLGLDDPTGGLSLTNKFQVTPPI